MVLGLGWCDGYQSGGWVGRKSTSFNKLLKESVFFISLGSSSFFSSCALLLSGFFYSFFCHLTCGEKNGNCFFDESFHDYLVGYGTESPQPRNDMPNDLLRNL